MTVVQYEAPPPLPASRPGDELEQGPQGWVARLRAAAEYAAYIAETEFVPEALRNRPAAIAAAMLYGAEVGFTPMQSLRSIAVIKGKPSLTSEAQRALVLAAGHELWFEESTTTRAIACGRRAGEERIGRITFTMDDAKRAGLAGQQNYRTYPAEMLRARASAALVRAVFADVIGGMPAAEELEDGPDNGPPIPPPTPPPPPPADVEGEEAKKPTRTRKRAPAREPVAPTPPVDTQPEPPVPGSEPGVSVAEALAREELANEPLATDAYRRRIFATMRELELADRDERLAYTSKVVGREVGSPSELRMGEAVTLVYQLDKDVAARAAGEPTLLDELRQPSLLDAPQGPQDAEEASGAPAPEPEPAGPRAPPETPAATPVPYNEFPDGF